jgi:hypothetical protein
MFFYAYGMGNTEKSLESLICERSSSIRLFLSKFRLDIARIFTSEESIIVQFTFPYSDGFHVKNGSVQSKLKEPVIEMVSSTSLKLLMEAR